MNREGTSKIYIDDIRNSPDDTWLVARSCTAAIRALSMYDFDEISIDHDISHQVHLGALSRPYPCEETFEAVAHFIGMKHRTKMIDDNYDRLAEKMASVKSSIPPYQPPKIHVHSSNPVGANAIIAILKDYGLPATATLSRAANRLEMNV